MATTRRTIAALLAVLAIALPSSASPSRTDLGERTLAAADRPEAGSETPLASQAFSRVDAKGDRIQVLIRDRVALSYRGKADKAETLVRQLNTLAAKRILRADRLTPGRRSSRYVIRAGEATLIEIDPDFARLQGQKPAQLAMDYLNALRTALGGVPIQVQASRGGIPGVVSRVGVASWYGGFFHGRRAASGERFDKHNFTAAHRSLPFGTLLLVTNLGNGKSALVRVTDRGPFVHGRILDLSQAAAKTIGMMGSGVAKVRIDIIRP